jgi:hypothetical protein
MIGKDRDGIPIDTLAILHTEDWLIVLAAPHIYRSLKRQVEPAFLLRLLDIFIPYADRGDHYLFDRAPDPDRSALARRLRDLIAAWTPPELPVEITEAARALLRAEGYEKPPLEAATWEDFNFQPDSDPLESRLAWPETDILRKEATDAEREAADRERSVAARKWLKDMGISR